ncbi:alpha/beta hydrolase [Corynebacterium heidelbergense]|uniref:Esterase family protein n=1 Tax=Corynebacterium heidelbergense TaxID=2055947 RepID=A0A364V717_9CORY|nr:alpha/beta hydrolase family protein [Corynebacterium heidelbergense]RAV32445.1 esterase family protein [Corynebacterium heidelbergense]
MKRSIRRIAAAVLATAAPIGATALAAPAAQASAISAAEQAHGAAPATLTFGQPTPGIEGKDRWRGRLEEFRKAGFDNVQEVWAHSPAMNRDIPLVVIQPKKPELRDNAPTLYLLNGADGGEGRANWINQTDVVQYYGGNDNPAAGEVSDGIGANIVMPMAGAFSYYSDWIQDAPSLGGKQAWETFMTKELPQAIEPALKANGNRAIAGMSMSATSSLLYAEHNPGTYDAVGSFSGCAATTTGLAPSFVELTLNRGGATPAQMWGGPNTDTARYNDALLNAEKLRGQPNIYVSNGTGIAGEYDWPTSPRINGNLSASGQVIVEGGVIEAGTNTCTHDLANRTNSLGIPVTYNFRPLGTHQWGYWQQDLRSFQPVLMAGLHPAK